MQTISTCGPAHKRISFNYRGNSKAGVVLEFETTETKISAEVFAAVTSHFSGQTVRGGFSMTEPPAGGVGAFVQQQGLSPRAASFICAILQHEGRAECTLDGNAVIVTFNE